MPDSKQIYTVKGAMRDNTSNENGPLTVDIKHMCSSWQMSLQTANIPSRVSSPDVTVTDVRLKRVL